MRVALTMSSTSLRGLLALALVACGGGDEWRPVTVAPVQPPVVRAASRALGPLEASIEIGENEMLEFVSSTQAGLAAVVSGSSSFRVVGVTPSGQWEHVAGPQGDTNGNGLCDGTEDDCIEAFTSAREACVTPAGDAVIYSDASNTLIALDAQTGERLFAATLPEGWRAMHLVSNGHAITAITTAPGERVGRAEVPLRCESSCEIAVTPIDVPQQGVVVGHAAMIGDVIVLASNNRLYRVDASGRVQSFGDFEYPHAPRVYVGQERTAALAYHGEAAFVWEDREDGRTWATVERNERPFTGEMILIRGEQGPFWWEYTRAAAGINLEGVFEGAHFHSRVAARCVPDEGVSSVCLVQTPGDVAETSPQVLVHLPFAFDDSTLPWLADDGDRIIIAAWPVDGSAAKIAIVPLPPELRRAPGPPPMIADH